MWMRIATKMLPAIVCGTYLVIHAMDYLFFVEDDAYISLRYSQRLLAGQGLTWTDGERVEGYSNLLWVLAAALLGALGVDLVVALRVLGVAGALAAVCAIAWAYRVGVPARALPALAGCFALVAVEHVPVWAVGGLETCMFAGLLAWALVTTFPLLEPRRVAVRSVVVPGVLLGLVCLTRPDGPLFTVAVCLGVLLVRGTSWVDVKTTAALAAIPAVCAAGQLAFRLVYYGELLPNTARAKLGFSLQRVLSGALHIGPAFLYAAPIVIAAGLTILYGRRDLETARRIRFLLVPLVLWTLYVMCIGGDTFRGRRHFVADAVILALMVAQGARMAMHSGPRTRRTAWFASVGLGAVLLVFQPRDPRLPKREYVWAQDGEALGLFFRAAFGERAPLLAVEPAGGPPYFSRLPALDMLGLNDRVLTEKRPDTFGTGKVGHELGDGSYTLSRRPDILMFCRPRNDGRPCFRGSRQIVRMSEFRRDYRKVRVETRRPTKVRSQVWFRVENGKLGVTRTERRIEVPGFLLASEHEAAAVLSGEHRVVARIRPGETGGFSRLKLPPGQWMLAVELEGFPLQIKVRHEKMTVETAWTSQPLRLESLHGHRIDLDLINTSQRDARIVRVVLTRTD